MRSCLVCLLLVLSACSTDPIIWRDPRAVETPAVASHLTIDSSGAARFVPAPAVSVPAPFVAGLCESSFRTARGTTRLYAAWWSVRPDSSAVLYTASSSDGGVVWGTPLAVDTLDVSSSGCDRPPPSVVTSGDDLHTAYSMSAPEGTGVFFAHFMGSMLHSPVAVIYGERLVFTAIAAEGDHVAVAYEEPNGRRQQVNVSVSLTQGHIFERHTTASRSIDAASRPAVAIRGSNIAVSWITRRPSDTAGTQIIREGRLR